MKKEYIEFNLVQQTEKTRIYAVRNCKSQLIIGYIKWYGAWRQYCFFPESETIFSNECVNDIKNFIKQLMEERKHVKKSI